MRCIFSNIMPTRNRFAALVPVSKIVCLDRFTTLSSRILTYSQCVNSMIISIRLDHGEGLVASFFINASLFVFYTCYTHVIRKYLPISAYMKTGYLENKIWRPVLPIQRVYYHF